MEPIGGETSPVPNSSHHLNFMLDS